MNKRPPAQLSDIEQNLSMLVAKSLQLERTIWLMAMEHGGEMVVAEDKLNPLWGVKYERVPDHPNLLKIIASTMTEPTDEQIAKLCETLVGKKAANTGGVVLECGLAGFAPAYLAARIAPTVRVNADNVWEMIKE